MDRNKLVLPDMLYFTGLNKSVRTGSWITKNFVASVSLVGSIPFLVGVALMLFMGCDPKPVINGSRSVAVGQEILITVEQGPGFVRNDLQLEDSEGNIYKHSSEELNYIFESDKKISFTIPQGIATGPARLYLGAEGRTTGYNIDLKVVRLVALLSESGYIHVIDTTTGKTVESTQLGAGKVSARLSMDGHHIIATARDEAVVHFLRFDGTGLRPYAPAIERVGTGMVDAVIIPSGALLAVKEGIAVINQLTNNATVLDGFLEVPPMRGLAGGMGKGRVIGLAEPSTDATGVGNQLYVVDLTDDGPEVRDQPFDIGGMPGSAGDMVLSKNGDRLYVADRIHDSITLITITDTNLQVSAPVLLPSEQISENEEIQHSDPIRVRLTPDETELIVLCGASGSMVRYEVTENGGLVQKGTVMLEGLPFDVGFVSKTAYIIVDNDVKKLDLESNQPEPTTVEWENTAGALTIMMQP